MRYLFWLPIEVISLVLQAVLAVFGFLRLLLSVVSALVKPLPILGVLIQLILLPINALIMFIYAAVSKFYMRTVVALDLKFGFATPHEVKEIFNKTGVVKSAIDRELVDIDSTRHYVTETGKLLEKYGDAIFDDKTGQTYKEAWDSDTDGDWRYGIRLKLLKKEGIIK